MTQTVLQAAALAVMAWCVWLLASSPPLTVEVRDPDDRPAAGEAATPLSGEARCDAVLHTGDGDIYLSGGSNGPEADFSDLDAVVDASGDSAVAVFSAVDDRCRDRRAARTGWAVMGGLASVLLLRLALAAPARRRRDAGDGPS